MTDHRTDSVVDDILGPQWSKTQACDTEDQTTDSDTLIPCGIREFEILRIRNLLIKDLTHHTEDVDSRDNDRGTSDDGACTMEHISVLE